MTTISEVCPAILDKDDLKHSSQVVIRSSSQVFPIVLGVLPILCFASIDEPGNAKKVFDIGPDYAWILGCLKRIWTLIAPHGVPSTADEVLSKRLVIFLDTNRVVASRLAAVRCESGIAPRIFILLAQAVSTLLLADQSTQLSTLLNKSICLSLLEIASLNYRALHSFQVSNEHILPTLLDIKDNDCFDGLENDFQVRFSDFERTAQCLNHLYSKLFY